MNGNPIEFDPFGPGCRPQSRHVRALPVTALHGFSPVEGTAEIGEIMIETNGPLSTKSATVLALIAQGHSYRQIAEDHPDITYRDIFEAAAEALRICQGGPDYHEWLAKMRERHPYAYERWSGEDDAMLETLHKEGQTPKAIAQALGRRSSAVSSRLRLHGLLA
jgi:hypothetical protein